MPLLPREAPMSDEPSDAQKLIAKAVRMHERNPWGQHDGWWECFCGAVYSTEHVADEVDKALGGLQREVLADYNSKPRRWVSSGWTVTE